MANHQRDGIDPKKRNGRGLMPPTALTETEKMPYWETWTTMPSTAATAIGAEEKHTRKQFGTKLADFQVRLSRTFLARFMVLNDDKLMRCGTKGYGTPIRTNSNWNPCSRSYDLQCMPHEGKWTAFCKGGKHGKTILKPGGRKSCKQINWMAWRSWFYAGFVGRKVLLRLQSRKYLRRYV